MDIEKKVLVSKVTMMCDCDWTEEEEEEGGGHEEDTIYFLHT